MVGYTYQSDTTVTADKAGKSRKAPSVDKQQYTCANQVRTVCVKSRSLSGKEKCFLFTMTLVMGLYFTTNAYNPTLLPIQFRFSPTCRRVPYTGSADNASSAPASIPRYTYPQPIVRDYTHFNDHSWMPRFNDMTTHQSAIRLLGNVSDLFRTYNVTYTLIHGTLLGSYMFHDLIPWDDDLDIIVAFDSINRVRKMLRDPRVSALYGVYAYRDPVNVYAPPYASDDVNVSEPTSCGPHRDLSGLTCRHTFQIFRHDSPKTLHRRQVGYPYIDIQFYGENATHVWPIDPRGEDPLVYDRTDFYPLQYRPYFDLWQPAPRQTHKVLQMKFHQFQCASKWYSHHTQTIAIGYKSKCHYIKDCYPYVKKSPLCSKGSEQLASLEQLVIDETIIHEVVIDEVYQDLKPFHL